MISILIKAMATATGMVMVTDMATIPTGIMKKHSFPGGSERSEDKNKVKPRMTSGAFFFKEFFNKKADLQERFSFILTHTFANLLFYQYHVSRSKIQ